MMKRHIALVGFMGTGKSTVGKVLAERLSIQFIETDSLVEVSLGMPVSSVFAQLGEEQFRAAEAKAIETACLAPPSVISVGGGAVTSCRVRSLLKRNCLVVLLVAYDVTILSRTSGVTGRPLLDALEPGARQRRVAELLAARAYDYKRTADITVDANQTVDCVVESVMSRSLAHLLHNPAMNGGESHEVQH